MDFPEGAPLEYKFRLSDGGDITIPTTIVAHFRTLKTMLIDLGEMVADLPVPIGGSITTPVMQWIVDAYTIYDKHRQLISEFDELYTSPPHVRDLVLFGVSRIPESNKKDIGLLIDVARTLNWLDADAMLHLVLSKIYQLLSLMPSTEIMSLINGSKNRRHEETGLPWTPYYRHQELIKEYLSAYLPSELLRANASNQKYINPVVDAGSRQFLLTSDGDLYAYSDESERTRQDVPGVILLVVAGDDFVLCLTTLGLYGQGKNELGQLGLGIRTAFFSEWTKVDVTGEVLLVACGRNHSVILTTHGVYRTGDNRYGQLCDESRQTPRVFTRIDFPPWDLFRDIYCGALNTFVMTSEDLYMCGTTSYLDDIDGVLGGNSITSIASSSLSTLIVSDDALYVAGNQTFGQLGLGSYNTVKTVKLTKVTDLVGRPLAVYGATRYSVLLTTEGLFATGNNKNGQLATGDSRERNRFTKMLGIEGDVQSVTCLEDSVIILTTTGLYQSGRPLSIPFVQKEYANWLSLTRFTKLDVEMGYFLSEGFLPKEELLLQCMHCRGGASFFALKHTEKLPFCSKYCLLSSHG